MDRESMQRLLAATRTRLRRAWISMVAHLRESNSEEAIAGRMHTLEPALVLNGFDAAVASWAAAEHNAYTTAGQTAARWLEQQVAKRQAPVEKKLLNFDPGGGIAAAWAEQNRLDLIREITDDQRELIHDALVRGAQSGANPKLVAREIRDTIGLTSYQEGVVQSYRAALESGQYAAALQRELSSGVSDRAIAAAQRAGRELTQAQIDLAVERYRANFVALRAETIARTEGLRVAHQGTEELYRQAIARGDLDRNELQRTWNHTAGKKRKNERAYHRVMHGQTRAYGETFVSGQGTELRYPGDPEAPADETIDCHCVLSTTLTGAGGSSGSPGLPGGGAAADDEVLIADDEAAIEDEATAGELDDGSEDGETAEDQPGEGDAADEIEPVDGTETGPAAEPSDLEVLQARDRVARAEAELAAANAAHARAMADAGRRPR